MESRDINFQITLNKSCEEVWKYFVEASLLEKWLTGRANVEKKLNGLYELFWEPDLPRRNSTIGCKIIAFEPGKILAHTWKGPVPYADLMNTTPEPTWVSVNFETVELSKTIVHFRHTGWGNTDRWKEAKKWQTNAWAGAFKELEKLCSSPAL